MRRAAGASPEDARTGGVSTATSSAPDGGEPGAGHRAARTRRTRLARAVRWLVAVAAAPALWACSSHRLSVPDTHPSVVDRRSFKQNINHKLDLLFMVDDSSSMKPLQKKMSDQLGMFMDILADGTTGQLPDLHVAVVSSSAGAGAWLVSGCKPGYPGDDRGKFVQGPGGPGHGSCPMLRPGARFLQTGDGTTPANYEGDIREAFKCIALLGDGGCGFEAQFKSVAMALSYASDPNNEDNGGFLRDDAVLAIVMVTNEDDCSVADNSLLLNPGVNSTKDASGLGAAQNYRCNEFGHLCQGQPPPHGYPDPIPESGVELKECVSAEDTGPKNDDLILDPNHNPDPTHGHLWPTVSDLTKFIKSLKPGRESDILVAAVAGPATPYRVTMAENPGTGELNPTIEHSCTLDTSDPDEPEYADPAVRIQQWVHDFGDNGLFYPICSLTLQGAMKGIAEKIHQTIGSSCLSTDLAWKDPDNHDEGHNCAVDWSAAPDGGTSSGSHPRDLPECQPIATNADAPEAPKNAPCYQLLPNAHDCRDPKTATLFRVCENAECKPPSTAVERVDATISCALP